MSITLSYKEIEKLWQVVNSQPNTSNPDYLITQSGGSGIGTNTYCIRRMPLRGFPEEDKKDITDYSLW